MKRLAAEKLAADKKNDAADKRETKKRPVAPPAAETDMMRPPTTSTPHRHRGRPPMSAYDEFGNLKPFTGYGIDGYGTPPRGYRPLAPVAYHQPPPSMHLPNQYATQQVQSDQAAAPPRKKSKYKPRTPAQQALRVVRERAKKEAARQQNKTYVEDEEDEDEEMEEHEPSMNQWKGPGGNGGNDSAGGGNWRSGGAGFVHTF